MFNVKFDEGINKYSGLMDIALESGHVTKPKVGWYQKVGEEKNYRLDKTNTEEFWSSILEDESFQNFVIYKFKLTNKILVEEEFEVEE
jgi:hypothetical protein